MKKFIELSIKGDKNEMASFVEKLKNYSSDAFIFKEMREDNIIRSSISLEFSAKKTIDFKSRVILTWNEDTLRICNIIPKTVSFLEIEQYNSVLRHFFEDVVSRLVPRTLSVDISKEENAMQDLISAPAYKALVLWEESCNKSAPTSHPNDRNRWLDFISELYINGDQLSLSDFRNWLIEDKGWYYDVDDDEDRTFLDLELDIEFGLDLLGYYAKKTRNR